MAKFDKRFRTAKLYNVKEFSGTEYLGRSILIDQSPIGRTPRSNPATYTGAWTHIRDLFAMSEEAKARGWGPGRFSFNVKGGRCEACQGNGLVAVEMHFLPTVYVTCDVCNGKRFMKETLEVKYKKKNIHDVLSMTVEEANAFFEDIPAITDRLQTLIDVGLSYLELGQSATTLSGGEAQRVKIASELYRPGLTKTMYLLDEPTVGLHYDDVAKLIQILQKLVEHGNTVVVIEHNLDVLKCADYIIDMGPEGGQGGGKLVAHGTPEEVAKTDGSHTGYYLKRVLKKKKASDRIRLPSVLFEYARNETDALRLSALERLRPPPNARRVASSMRSGWLTQSRMAIGSKTRIEMHSAKTRARHSLNAGKLNDAFVYSVSSLARILRPPATFYTERYSFHDFAFNPFLRMFRKRHDECFCELAVGNKRNVQVHRFSTDDEAILSRTFDSARWDVDHQVKVATFDELQDAGFFIGAYLVDFFAKDIVVTQKVGRVFRREQFEFHLGKFLDRW